jgi:hypothetical protein
MKSLQSSLTPLTSETPPKQPLSEWEVGSPTDTASSLQPAETQPAETQPAGGDEEADDLRDTANDNLLRGPSDTLLSQTRRHDYFSPPKSLFRHNL